MRITGCALLVVAVAVGGACAESAKSTAPPAQPAALKVFVPHVRAATGGGAKIADLAPPGVDDAPLPDDPSGDPGTGGTGTDESPAVIYNPWVNGGFTPDRATAAAGMSFLGGGGSIGLTIGLSYQNQPLGAGPDGYAEWNNDIPVVNVNHSLEASTFMPVSAPCGHAVSGAGTFKAWKIRFGLDAKPANWGTVGTSQAYSAAQGVCPADPPEPLPPGGGGGDAPAGGGYTGCWVFYLYNIETGAILYWQILYCY